MLKALLLQAWHGLGDPEMESLLETQLAFRRFTGFTLDMKIPDHSTIWKFRQQLHRLGLLQKILDEVKTQLEQKRAMVKKGKVAVVDATVTEALRWRPKKNRNGDNRPGSRLQCQGRAQTQILRHLRL